MLLSKYKPTKLSELAGNKSQAAKILNLVKNYKKPILVVGPPGSGKTTAIQLIGKELNYEIVNLNADELRDYNAIRNKVISASVQRSLFMKRKMIVIDEAETVSSVKGVKELVETSKFPVILIANDIYDSRIRSLANMFETVKFYKIRSDSIERILKKIALKEGIKIKEKEIHQIALNSDGDLRAAILDLESRNLEFYRDKLKGIFDVLGIVFKSSTYENALNAVIDSDKDLGELKWWIEENIANEYEKPEEIARAFKILSYEDLVESRIMKRQSWGLMSYLGELLAAVSICKKEKYKKFTRYSPPKRFRKKKLSKEEIEILERYARQLHLSIERFAKDPIIKKLVKNLDIPKEEKKLIEKISGEITF